MWSQKKPRWNNNGGQWDNEDQISGFTPSGLPAAWWDASAETGFSNNDTVGTLTDQSGNGKNLTQSVELDKPIFKTNIQNGLPGIDFSDGGDYLIILNASFSLTNPVTYFLVMTWIGVANDRFVISCDSFGNNPSEHLIGVWTATTFNLDAGTTLSGTTQSTGAYLYSITVNGASSEIRRNGSQIASGNSGVENMAGLTLGSGRGGSLTGPNAYVHELIVYDSVEDVTANEAMLNTKWSIY
jgi:hypothetical protein